MCMPSAQLFQLVDYETYTCKPNKCHQKCSVSPSTSWEGNEGLKMRQTLIPTFHLLCLTDLFEGAGTGIVGHCSYFRTPHLFFSETMWKQWRKGSYFITFWLNHRKTYHRGRWRTVTLKFSYLWVVTLNYEINIWLFKTQWGNNVLLFSWLSFVIIFFLLK